MPLSSFIRPPSPVKRDAFTLVELMVSIALALLLLVGVNQVFKTTTATVGTGYATSQVMREHLATEKALARDIEKAVGPSQMPVMIIHSQQVYAFRDRNDMNADKDGNAATADPISSGTEVDVEPADFGERSHRIDTISFFAKDIDDPFRRTTGDQTPGSSLVSAEKSSEAFIWIGHLRLPDNSPNPNPGHSDATPMAIADSSATSNGQYFDPGQATATANPNNFFANDWALGHQVVLLKASPAANYISGGAGILSPLSKSSTANFTDPVNPSKGTASAWTIPQSRIDVANTTIADYRDNKISKAGLPLSAAAVDSLDYRFNGKPWVTKPTDPSSANYMPILAREMALTAPFLSRGCTQFMVEFAGDFVTQDNDPASGTYGTVTGATPDGVLDFHYAAGIRRTQWYGFPRDTGGAAGAADGHITVNFDVVPVRDIANGTVMSFEKVLPAQTGDYGKQVAGGLAANSQYICAWGPNELNPTTGYASRPWMLRFVLQLTDSNGRLGEGRVVEYVYTLPQY